jgi:hypothetical protein
LYHFGNGFNAEFFGYFAAVNFYGVFGNIELSGNLFIQQSGNQ